MNYLYKYPQAAYPYADLVETNRRRTRTEFEYELLDTGIFQEDRYFDVFVEYAKKSPEDILIRITVHNRGPEPAGIHILPTLWFRNDWARGWPSSATKPRLSRSRPADIGRMMAEHAVLGTYCLYCEGGRSVALHRKFDQSRASPSRLPG